MQAHGWGFLQQLVLFSDTVASLTQPESKRQRIWIFRGIQALTGSCFNFLERQEMNTEGSQSEKP